MSSAQYGHFIDFPLLGLLEQSKSVNPIKTSGLSKYEPIFSRPSSGCHLFTVRTSLLLTDCRYSRSRYRQSPASLPNLSTFKRQSCTYLTHNRKRALPDQEWPVPSVITSVCSFIVVAQNIANRPRTSLGTHTKSFRTRIPDKPCK